MLLRKFKNKSQSDIAGKMKKTQQYVSLMEKQKKINGKNLDEYLSALNSNRDEFEKFKKGLPPPPYDD